MKIKQAKFVTSFSQASKYLDTAANRSPELCVVGRSNVGKSTFINTLAGRPKLARTSSTPGRTRLINLFDFNDGEFVLVDLPGYGYAKASKAEKNDWGELMEGYLQRSTALVHTLVLVDSRHEPTELDLTMVKYLYYYRMPFSVIATKCDKISKAERGRSVQRIATKLGIGRDDVILTAADGTGMDKVLARLEAVLAATKQKPQNDEND